MQCCNKSSHWLGLGSTRVTIFYLTWLDSIFHLNDLTWLDHLWNDSDFTLTWPHVDSSQRVTRVMTIDSSNDTHTHKVFSVNNVELWTMIVPSFNFRWENITWYYLVTSVNIKMVHSSPLRVFICTVIGHWDDHTVDEIFLSVYKRGIHYTILTWGDLKEKITWLDLKKYSNDLTWLATRVLLTWLDLWLEQGWLVTTLIICRTKWFDKRDRFFLLRALTSEELAYRMTNVNILYKSLKTSSIFFHNENSVYWILWMPDYF